MQSMALSENIKRLRTKHRLSQADLAESIGVSHPRISDIERGVGNPTLKTLGKLADFFGVSVADLLKQKKSKQSA